MNINQVRIMKNKVSMLTWNLNHRSGHCFSGESTFSIKEAAKENADINVLVEVALTDKVLSVLNQSFPRYEILTTENANGQNNIVICVRKNITILSKDILIASYDNDNPNLLILKLQNKKGFEWYQIGVRIRLSKIDGDFYYKQIAIINQDLEKIGGLPWVMSGDFNAYKSSLKKHLCKGVQIHTPEHRKDFWYTSKFIDNYSFLFATHGKVTGKGCIDHVISKGITVDNVRYNWDFIENSDVYPTRNEIFLGNAKWSIPTGFPDHAKLFNTIEFE